MNINRVLVLSLLLFVCVPVFASDRFIGLVQPQPEEECGLTFYSKDPKNKGLVFSERSGGPAVMNILGNGVTLQIISSQAKEKNHQRREYKAPEIRVVVDYHVARECKQETMPGCEHDELEGMITVEKKGKTETIAVYGYDGC